MVLEKHPHQHDFEEKSCVVCLVTFKLLSKLSESTPVVIKELHYSGKKQRQYNTKHVSSNLFATELYMIALAEHSGTTFTLRVTLPGEYSPDVLHPFRPGAPLLHDEVTCMTGGGNVPGNEVADFLAKRGCSEIATINYALTYREIYSLMKIKDKQVWIAPPDHPGISRKSPGGALKFDGNRNDQTAVFRLISGHFKDMTFESGRKVFQTCSKCHLLPASPEHILDGLGLALEDVHASPFLVLEFDRVNGLMDLI
ncbi:RNase H domain-containing protein [Trichonephila clavipes]|nr:RNase H domain-containing protein [Trichonephila clavipes]